MHTKSPLESEDLFTLGKVSKRYSYWVLRQWAERGRKSYITGQIVKLEVRQIGGRRYTSVQAVERFNAKLNGEKL